jgi:putative ABC transport system substrate-binding protein
MSQSEADPLAHERLAILVTALREAGWIEGRNLSIEYRWAAADAERSRRLAAELATYKPDVIFAVSTPTVRALLSEAPSIPTVFVGVTDPLGSGLVGSLARPGGNLTGFANFEPSMIGKWAELLREIQPSITTVGALFNPATSPRSGELYITTARRLTAELGFGITPYPVEGEHEITRAMTQLSQSPRTGMMVLPDISVVNNRALVTSLASQLRLPTIYPFRFFVSEGGLLYYGINGRDLYRRAAGYIDRILHGAVPGDLPVEQPTTFELVINLGTAKALNLAIPPTLLARADEVIE